MAGSIRTRLLAAFLSVALLAAVALSLYFLAELESYGLRKLEERLHTEALLVAALVSPGAGERLDSIDAGALQGRLAGVGPEVFSRVRVLDADGRTLADSGEEARGTPHPDAPEVAAALAGRYGAHTRVLPDGRVALYVAVPIRDGDAIVGAAYVSATTFSIRTLLRDYRLKLAALVLVFVGVALAAAETLARWLSRPLRDLEAVAASFAADHSARVAPSGSRETRAVAAAFNEMADEVAGVVEELREEEQRKSRFISDVSHELRTPLTAIRGAAETLAGGDVPEEDARRFLRTIVSESDRLSRLAADLVALQRIEGATGELPLRRIDLAAVARAAVVALESLLTSRGVRVAVEGTAPEVLGDPDRIQQVVANLVENASRATRAPGEVRVVIGTEGTWTVLEVLDEGPGVPEEDLPRIFDRFYRADPSRGRGSGGFGLGLAIVKAIVAAHAGTITAARRPEGGMRFVVRLPSLPE